MAMEEKCTERDILGPVPRHLTASKGDIGLKIAAALECS